MSDALEQRVTALEHDYQELRDLVDGQELWSHRKRLHALENDQHAAELVQQALDAYRETRDRTSNKFREWGSFVIACTAIIYSIVSHH